MEHGRLESLLVSTLCHKLGFPMPITRPKIPAQFARKYADLQITVLSLTRTYFYRRHNKHTITLAQFQTRICKHNSLLYVKNLINQQCNISL
jgi:hypothetical protein